MRFKITDHDKEVIIAMSRQCKVEDIDAAAYFVCSEWLRVNKARLYRSSRRIVRAYLAINK